jgi:diacylglycerol O-acyltransferase / wax synthase
MSTMKPLSPLEAVFLHIESERSPMHMASLALFEGAPLTDDNGDLRVDDVRHLISSRLDLVPKLRQRPHPGLLNEAPLRWNDDPGFDIANHVTESRLPNPGTEEQLLGLCGELLSVPLDRSRPLWELTFVTGLEDDRVALIERLHHSMADGLAAAELATVLLDLSPHPAEADQPTPWHPAAPASAMEATFRDLVELAGIGLRVPAWIGWSALHPIRRAASLQRTATAFASWLRGGIIAPRSPLNLDISASRAFHVVRIDLDEVKAVAHAHGAKVNDVVLTVVAGGLRPLLWGRGGDLPEDFLAVVPVDMAGDVTRDMDNQVSTLFVRLPLDKEDPVECLGIISDETRALKAQHQEAAFARALRLLDPVPQSVLAFGSRLFQHQHFFNLIVTNVPGPPVPLYALGARLLEAFPVVPLIGDEGLAVAALSYDGSLSLGILSDPTVCPDIQVFCDGAEQTIRQLVGTSPHRSRVTGAGHRAT